MTPPDSASEASTAGDCASVSPPRAARPWEAPLIEPRAIGERPRAVFLTAAWRQLVFLNYEFDPAVLEPLVTPGVELDRFEGRVLASIVGFRFANVRVLGLPVPGYTDFDEVNLRFYVRRQVETAHGPHWRRGVVFVKEIVPKRLVAWVARGLYGERYEARRMRSRRGEPAGVGGVSHRYEWAQSKGWGHVAAASDEPGTCPPLAVPGEENEQTFITEHYYGYARTRLGRTVEYEVAHPRWAVAEATTASYVADVARVYGPQFVESLSGQPTTAFLAEGSPVAIHWGRRLPASAGP